MEFHVISTLIIPNELVMINVIKISNELIMIAPLLQNGQHFIISGKSFLLPLVFLAIILIMMNSFGIQAYIMQDSIGRPS